MFYGSTKPHHKASAYGLNGAVIISGGGFKAMQFTAFLSLLRRLLSRLSRYYSRNTKPHVVLSLTYYGKFEELLEEKKTLKLPHCSQLLAIFLPVRFLAAPLAPPAG